MPPDLTGIASVESPSSVEATLARLEAAIQGRGLILFAHIDHGAGAAQAGLEMQKAHVLIFGQAKAGTPLMVAHPLLALELPLRVLVWEDAGGKVWVSHTMPGFLAQRFGISPDLLKKISGVAQLIEAALA